MSQISLYDVPHKAILALAFGMAEPEQVLRDFDFEDAQITWLLNSPELKNAVEETRRQLEKTGEMDVARVRMHAISQMEHCTKRVQSGLLREVDVKYLDTLFKASGIGAKQAAQAETGARFSITFNLRPPAGKGTTVEGSAERVPTNLNFDLTALAEIALPEGEY